ncbi:RING finger protein 112 isoform X4 [Dasypus novemcinctus]|nr:RING finger protein 112 isoform X4 [Dasypus novemcinctus]
MFVHVAEVMGKHYGMVPIQHLDLLVRDSSHQKKAGPRPVGDVIQKLSDKYPRLQELLLQGKRARCYLLPSPGRRWANRGQASPGDPDGDPGGLLRAYIAEVLSAAPQHAKSRCRGHWGDGRAAARGDRRLLTGQQLAQEIKNLSGWMGRTVPAFASPDEVRGSPGAGGEGGEEAGGASGPGGGRQRGLCVDRWRPSCTTCGRWTPPRGSSRISCGSRTWPPSASSRLSGSCPTPCGACSPPRRTPSWRATVGPCSVQGGSGPWRPWRPSCRPRPRPSWTRTPCASAATWRPWGAPWAPGSWAWRAAWWGPAWRRRPWPRRPGWWPPGPRWGPRGPPWSGAAWAPGWPPRWAAWRRRRTRGSRKETKSRCSRKSRGPGAGASPREGQPAAWGEDVGGGRAWGVCGLAEAGAGPSGVAENCKSVVFPDAGEAFPGGPGGRRVPIPGACPWPFHRWEKPQNGPSRGSRAGAPRSWAGGGEKAVDTGQGCGGQARMAKQKSAPRSPRSRGGTPPPPPPSQAGTVCALDPPPPGGAAPPGRRPFVQVRWPSACGLVEGHCSTRSSAKELHLLS